MPDNQPNIPVYSADDLLRYATGRMTASEMHALEKATMEDPFLAEALEGFHMAAETNTQHVLQTQIDRLTPTNHQKEKSKIVPLWRKKIFRYAAVAVFVAGGGWLMYSIVHQNEDKQQENIAIASTPEMDKPVTTSTSIDTIAISSGVAADSTTANRAPASTINQDSYANAETYKSKRLEPNQEEKESAQSDNGFIARDSIIPMVSDNTRAQNDQPKKTAIKDQPLADAATIASSPVISKEAASKMETVSKKPLAKPRADDSDKLNRNNASAETRYVFKGKITDAKNNPLPYANVMISGEEVGTYTDTKGNFNFTYDDSILPVRTRSLGYESQTVQLKPGNKEQQIVMQEDEKLKESLALTVQKPVARQNNFKPLIIETDSLSSAEPVVSIFDYNTYLLNNNRISELPRSNRAVELSFEVNKRGEVKNITVEQSSGKELDAEAIRLLKEGPKWKPNNGGTGKARVKVKL